jgi:putative transposase
MAVFDQQKHHRHSIRLKGYDYAQAGAYYLTIVAQNRECLFGKILDDEIELTEAGKMLEKWWYELPIKFPFIETDEFVIMPNHFHGIILINLALHAPATVGADQRVSPGLGVCQDQGSHIDASLSEIVQWFKTMTTNAYIRGVKQLGWLPFDGKLWQRNYYEHIIRNEVDLERIRKYILNNPFSWKADDENPLNVVKTHA